MGWWRKLWMSKVDKLKEKGDIEGLVDLLMFANLGGVEKRSQCCQAISALLELGKMSEEVHDQLTTMIVRNEPDQVCQAVRSLSSMEQLGDLETKIVCNLMAFVYCIYAVVKGETHVPIRQCCAEALRKVDGESVQQIVEFLALKIHEGSIMYFPASGMVSAGAARVPAMRIELLGEIGGPDVIRTLEHVLFNFSFHQGWPYYCAAARALGKIGGKEAIEVLEKSKKVLGGWALDEVVEVLQRLKQTGTE